MKIDQKVPKRCIVVQFLETLVEVLFGEKCEGKQIEKKKKLKEIMKINLNLIDYFYILL